MRLRPNPLVLLAVASFALAFAAVISLGILAVRRSTAETEIARLLAVRDVVLEEYVEPLPPDLLTRYAIEGLVGSLDDYSRYVAEKREAAEIEAETTGRFGGIGVVLDPDAESGVDVLFPQPDSVAEQAGLRPGTRIVAIDGVAAEGLDRAELMERIRGPEGTPVRVAFRDSSGSPTREASIRRQVVRRASVRHVSILDPARGIGSLWIASFSEETAAQFDDAVKSLLDQGARALILDLRFNAGGVLAAAAEIANRFLRGGVIYEQRGRAGALARTAKPQAAALAGLPAVVLVNGESASASEVLAGALGDHRVAAIVGERTYGKGVVQSQRRFEDTGAYLRITTARYFTPSGRNLDRPRALVHGAPPPLRAGGVAPDVEVPTSRAERLHVEANLAVWDIPPRYRAEVEAIRAARGRPPRRADDRQMEAALRLLRGERPEDSPFPS